MKHITICLALLFSSISHAQIKINVALVQSGFVWGDADANIEAFDKKIKTIDSCDLIVLPELFISGCQMVKTDSITSFNQKKKIASYYDTVINKMREWAAESNALVVGSTIYSEDDRFYNRLLAVYPNGDFKHYDKHNCFKKGGFTAGNEHLVVNWKGVRFATYICYDLRFEDWSKNDNRFDAAIYIANWPKSRSNDWKRLLKERAVQNKATVIGVNCVGTDLAGKEYQGDSRVISPDGKIIGKCSENSDEIKIVNCEFIL